MSDPELEPLRSNDGFEGPSDGILSVRQSKEICDVPTETAVPTDGKSKVSFLETLIHALGVPNF